MSAVRNFFNYFYEPYKNWVKEVTDYHTLKVGGYSFVTYKLPNLLFNNYFPSYKRIIHIKTPAEEKYNISFNNDKIWHTAITAGILYITAEPMLRKYWILPITFFSSCAYLTYINLNIDHLPRPPAPQPVGEDLPGPPIRSITCFLAASLVFITYYFHVTLCYLYIGLSFIYFIH